MNAPIAHINCLGVNFPITHICYTKELFPNCLCDHCGPHSTSPGVQVLRSTRLVLLHGETNMK